jgi:hypothetical protein
LCPCLKKFHASTVRFCSCLDCDFRNVWRLGAIPSLTERAA